MRQLKPPRRRWPLLEERRRQPAALAKVTICGSGLQIIQGPTDRLADCRRSFWNLLSRWRWSC